MYNATRVPDSCCLEFSESCGLHAPGTWWKAVSAGKACGRGTGKGGQQPAEWPLLCPQPCYETVKVWLQENLLAVGIFGLCTALVQVCRVPGPRVGDTEVTEMTQVCHMLVAGPRTAPGSPSSPQPWMLFLGQSALCLGTRMDPRGSLVPSLKMEALGGQHREDVERLGFPQQPVFPADSGPDLRHDHVLPGAKGGHLLCIAAQTPALLCQRTRPRGGHTPGLSTRARGGHIARPDTQGGGTLRTPPAAGLGAGDSSECPELSGSCWVDLCGRGFWHF